MNRLTLALAITLTAPLTARAQVTNGDFETGALAPWTITNTTHGTAVVQSVGIVDIDGPGPRPASYAVSVMAGQGGGASAIPEGVIVHQTVTLQAGITYIAGFSWGVFAYIPAPDGNSSGIFDFLIDIAGGTGTSIAQGSAPSLGSGQRASGGVAATFTPTQSGTHEVGVRITRAVGAGYEQMQYVDDIFVRPYCRADFDGSGQVNPADVAAFINAWYTSLQVGTLAGDFDLSGAVDPADVAAFIQAWFDALTGGAC